MTATKIRYYVNGRRRGDTLNKFGNIAYFYTKGIGGKERLSTTELKALLARNGIPDHAAYPWEVTLSNGVVLAAKADRAVAAPRKAPAKKATKRAPARKTTKKSPAKRTTSSQRAKAGVKPLPKKKAATR